MPHELGSAPTLVTGPDGLPMSRADLPPPGTRRWIARRKAQVVFAVRQGLIGLEEACKRYSLSSEEFATWEAALDGEGLRGLRANRIHQLRFRGAPVLTRRFTGAG